MTVERRLELRLLPGLLLVIILSSTPPSFYGSMGVSSVDAQEAESPLDSIREVDGMWTGTYRCSVFGSSIETEMWKVSLAHNVSNTRNIGGFVVEAFRVEGEGRCGYSPTPCEWSWCPDPIPITPRTPVKVRWVMTESGTIEPEVGCQYIFALEDWQGTCTSSSSYDGNSIESSITAGGGCCPTYIDPCPPADIPLACVSRSVVSFSEFYSLTRFVGREAAVMYAELYGDRGYNDDGSYYTYNSRMTRIECEAIGPPLFWGVPTEGGRPAACYSDRAPNIHLNLYPERDRRVGRVDCTNFVSHALRAGGIDNSFASASALGSWLQENAEQKDSIGDLSPGDIVMQYVVDMKGLPLWKHAQVYVGDGMIAQHSGAKGGDTSGMNWNKSIPEERKTAFFHITYPDEGPQPPSGNVQSTIGSSCSECEEPTVCIFSCTSGSGASFDFSDFELQISGGTFTSDGTMTALPSAQPFGDLPFTALSPFVEVSTDAAFTGSMTIRLLYSVDLVPLGSSQEDVRLFKFSQGEWTDITTSTDTANRLVIGLTNGFSIFVAGLPDEGSSRDPFLDWRSILRSLSPYVLVIVAAGIVLIVTIGIVAARASRKSRLGSGAMYPALQRHIGPCPSLLHQT